MPRQVSEPKKGIRQAAKADWAGCEKSGQCQAERNLIRQHAGTENGSAWVETQKSWAARACLRKSGQAKMARHARRAADDLILSARP